MHCNLNLSSKQIEYSFINCLLFLLLVMIKFVKARLLLSTTRRIMMENQVPVTATLRWLVVLAKWVEHYVMSNDKFLLSWQFEMLCVVSEKQGFCMLLHREVQ